jgi:predicted MPP superfamily phosphohydrolase
MLLIGGQIRLFDRTSGSYRHFHVGVKKTGPDRYFAISRGLGTVKLPIRLNCFPEISVYDIRNG